MARRVYICDAKECPWFGSIYVLLYILFAYSSFCAFHRGWEAPSLFPMSTFAQLTLCLYILYAFILYRVWTFLFDYYLYMCMCQIVIVWRQLTNEGKCKNCAGIISVHACTYVPVWVFVKNVFVINKGIFTHSRNDCGIWAAEYPAP